MPQYNVHEIDGEKVQPRPAPVRIQSPSNSSQHSADGPQTELRYAILKS